MGAGLGCDICDRAHVDVRSNKDNNKIILDNSRKLQIGPAMHLELIDWLGILISFLVIGFDREYLDPDLFTFDINLTKRAQIVTPVQEVCRRLTHQK